MEQINISFVAEEGACPRLIRMIEWRGGRVVSIEFADSGGGALSQLRMVYENRGDDHRGNALIKKLRTIPGVADVTRGDLH